MPKIGFKHSEESRLKMSNSKLGCVPWNKGKKGLQIAWNKGIPISKEAREKNRLAHLGRKLSEEHRNKIRLSMQGINAGVKNPMYGKHPIMEFKKGDKRIVGKNNPNWRGGISFEPYGKDFNNALKELIRRRDNYKCQLCGAPQEEFYKKLDIHHINYNKKDNNPNNLITLCPFCHKKTNGNRAYWEVKLKWQL